MLEALQQLDSNILLFIQQMHVSWLDPLISGFTMLGNAGILWIVLSVLMLCFQKTRKAGLISILALLIGVIITNVTIKPLVERPRPWLDLPIVPLVEEHDPHSFPSGHTCAAFAAGIVWLKTLPWKWGRGSAVVLAVLMGVSRLYVGVHYPTDVLAGAVIGTLSACIALKLYLYWKRDKL